MPRAAPLESMLRLGKIMSTAPVLLECLGRLRVTTRYINPRLFPPPATRRKSFPNTPESPEDGRSLPIIAAPPTPNTNPTNRLDGLDLPGSQTQRNPLRTMTTAMRQQQPRHLAAAETAPHQQRATTTRQQTHTTALLAAASARASHHPRHALATPTWTITTALRPAAPRL